MKGNKILIFCGIGTILLNLEELKKKNLCRNSKLTLLKRGHNVLYWVKDRVTQNRRQTLKVGEVRETSFIKQ